MDDPFAAVTRSDAEFAANPSDTDNRRRRSFPFVTPVYSRQVTPKLLDVCGSRFGGKSPNPIPGNPNG